MKTERRHELQTNVLADSLARWIDKVKPYSRAALALVVAIVVAIFAWGYLAAQNSRRTTEGWNAYFEAMDDRDPREALSDIASSYSGTPVSDWARLTLADIQLLEGTNRLMVQKKDGRDELRQASEKYRSIISDSRQPMLLDRATFGLARAHEALGTPESLEEARKEYRSIGQQWPDSPYVKDANQRADDLDRGTTKNFYDWLAQYEPPAPATRGPGTPGARPDFLKDPSETGGPDLPSAVDSTALPKFDGPASAPSTPAAESPAAESPAVPSDSDKPAEPPAEGEKPAEPKPE